MPKIKRLVKKESSKAEEVTATSEVPTADHVAPGKRTDQSPSGVQPARAAILGSNQAYSSEAKLKATVSSIECVKSAAVHKDFVKPGGKGAGFVDDDTDTLTNTEENLFCAFLVCSFAGGVYGAYVAACYINTLVVDLFS